MAPPNKPIVGELYSSIEQSEMHGGTLFRCAPPKDGRVLLLKVKPHLNPEALRIIDWEASNDPWVKAIEEQDGTLPVYVFRRPNAWEYMGRFRVARVATDAATLAERRKRTGHKVSYAIHLERS